MANDTTQLTDKLSIEYPVDGYDSSDPTWADLYAQAFQDIDAAIGDFTEIEDVRDEIGSVVTDGDAIDIVVDDAADTVTVSVDASAISHDVLADISAGDHRTDEQIEDIVAALLGGGDKVSVSYDDANGSLTINTSALDAEEVRDEIGAVVTGGSGVVATVDDAGDELTLSVDELAITETFVVADETERLSLDVQEGDVAVQTDTEESYIYQGGDPSVGSDWAELVTDPGAHSASHESGGTDELDVTGLSGVLADAQTPQTEAVQDIANGLLSGGTNISLSYDDANDVLTVDTSALNQEEVEDAVGALVTAGNAITINYDDANDALAIGVDESAISHDGIDQSTVSSDDHHTRYSDSEAADAAPVQSVLGRVGQVAAQAGDYAASQISNFGSAVIGAVDGSDITPSSVDTPAVNTEGAVIGGTYRWASQYGGADADARLDAALSAASNGDKIYLEKATYTKDRTISQGIEVTGPSNTSASSAVIDATWTLSVNTIHLEKVRVDNTAEVVISGRFCTLTNLSCPGSVTIQADDNKYVNNIGGTVTFESGTSNGIVDACIGVSVTDNGANDTP